MFREVVEAGDAFAFDPAITDDEALAIWWGPKAHVYMAEEAGQLLGSCYIKPNQPGRGDHVANGGFMVSAAARGRGLGRKLGEFAIEEAKRLGFTAMQFNYVVASNQGAVKLWQDLGFDIVGTVPGAFRHITLGPTDIHIMFRTL